MARKHKVHIMGNDVLKEKTSNAFWLGVTVVLIIVAIAISM